MNYVFGQGKYWEIDSNTNSSQIKTYIYRIESTAIGINKLHHTLEQQIRINNDFYFGNLSHSQIFSVSRNSFFTPTRVQWDSTIRVQIRIDNNWSANLIESVFFNGEINTDFFMTSIVSNQWRVKRLVEYLFYISHHMKWKNLRSIKESIVRQKKMSFA